MRSAFWSGSTCAITMSMPSSFATVSATACASPVIITTSSFMSWSRLIASIDSGRTASATANTASMRFPSIR